MSLPVVSAVTSTVPAEIEPMVVWVPARESMAVPTTAELSPMKASVFVVRPA